MSQENAGSLAAYLQSARSRQLEELEEWLRIPSISTLPAHKQDVRRAAEWLVDHLRQIGLHNVRLIESDIHPLVYADWLDAGPDAPTVLCYGHFDVQPVDPLDKWATPPFEPTLRGDDLYARGASDDKGQTFIHVKAIEALLATTGRLPVNVKLLIEGEEEFGGETIEHYVKTHQAELACDAVLISDTHILSPTQPSIIYGLRGMWAAEVTVTTARRDLHSGSFGGAVHNANQALAELAGGAPRCRRPRGRPGFLRPGACAHGRRTRSVGARAVWRNRTVGGDGGQGRVGRTGLHRHRACRRPAHARNQRHVGRLYRRRL